MMPRKEMKKAAASSSNDDHEEVIYPTDDDILCGKSKACVNHVGSKRYREFLETFRVRYSEATTKYQKMMITKEIYESLRRRHCRFLRFNKSRGEWEEVNHATARDKISHALRWFADNSSSTSATASSSKPRASPVQPQSQITTGGPQVFGAGAFPQGNSLQQGSTSQQTVSATHPSASVAQHPSASSQLPHTNAGQPPPLTGNAGQPPPLTPASIDPAAHASLQLEIARALADSGNYLRLDSHSGPSNTSLPQEEATSRLKAEDTQSSARMQRTLEQSRQADLARSRLGTEQQPSPTSHQFLGNANDLSAIMGLINAGAISTAGYQTGQSGIAGVGVANSNLGSFSTAPISTISAVLPFAQHPPPPPQQQQQQQQGGIAAAPSGHNLQHIGESLGLALHGETTGLRTTTGNPTAVAPVGQQEQGHNSLSIMQEPVIELLQQGADPSSTSSHHHNIQHHNN